MNTVRELRVRLRPAEIHRFLGYPEDREPPERIARLIRPLMKLSRELIRARGIWRRLSGASAREIDLALPQRWRFGELALGLVTLGGELEARAAEMLASGETTSALILEAIGSAGAEEAADRLSAELLGLVQHPEISCTVPWSRGPISSLRLLDDAPASPAEPRLDLDPRSLQHCARNSGVLYLGPGEDHHDDKSTPQIGCRVSPGYGDWPLEAQAQLFERLPGQRIGVRLTESMLMLPRKSISFALPLERGAAPLRLGCDQCGLERCPFRRGGRRK